LWADGPATFLHLLPPEAEYASVVATVDVTLQRLRVTPGGKLATELDYPLP
jgi:hypothetical protein